jgi:prolyl-tRNA editing enzyme YbaK/EbsC (Cys-tRNA(Pro) deacylase)
VETEAGFDIEALAIETASDREANLNSPRHISTLLRTLSGRRSEHRSSGDTTMAEELTRSAQKIQDTLQELGVQLEVKLMPATTRTAKDAAAALGCTIDQIAKSLVFKTRITGRPILVIASGSVRVAEAKIGELVNEPIEKADADFVREMTGFAIGGVPPVGHTRTIETFIDESLAKYSEIWAAAGTPNAVFRLSPSDLERITKGRYVSVQ